MGLNEGGVQTGNDVQIDPIVETKGKVSVIVDEKVGKEIAAHVLAIVKDGKCPFQIVDCSKLPDRDNWLSGMPRAWEVRMQSGNNKQVVVEVKFSVKDKKRPLENRDEWDHYAPGETYTVSESRFQIKLGLPDGNIKKLKGEVLDSGHFFLGKSFNSIDAGDIIHGVEDRIFGDRLSKREAAEQAAAKADLGAIRAVFGNKIKETRRG